MVGMIQIADNMNKIMRDIFASRIALNKSIAIVTENLETQLAKSKANDFEDQSFINGKVSVKSPCEMLALSSSKCDSKPVVQQVFFY